MRLAVVALGLGVLTSASGCHIVADAAYRDAQRVPPVPQAIADGAYRDIKNYERWQYSEWRPAERIGQGVTQP